jgi:hypothetical protein
MSVHPKRLKDIRDAFTALFPLAPFADAEPIRERACRAQMNNLTADTAVWLAALAHLRHEHTDYDALLAEGYDRDSARFFIIDDINIVLTKWRAARFLNPDDIDQLQDSEEPEIDQLENQNSSAPGEAHITKTVRRARPAPRNS